MVTQYIGHTVLKSEVRLDLQGCLETIVASEAAKRAHSIISEAVFLVALKPAKSVNIIAVLIVDSGLQGHCPLVKKPKDDTGMTNKNGLAHFIIVIYTFLTCLCGLKVSHFPTMFPLV